ncbi:MAG: hypothetical protein JSV88_27715 [Candidatus Aminicenantes bacterium]|nr:MAG: hypothetical protein JSV88_27715 [Candidatus Aminicenantes bacterium]
MMVLTAISDLKRKCISYLNLGEIEAVGNDLVFFLDNREINRIYLPELEGLSGNIYFNRYGMTAGGEILIRFTRVYKIVVQEVSGRIWVE